MRQNTITSLHDRIYEYGIDYLTDAEALAAITGINLKVIHDGIKAFGYHGLIRYVDLLKITNEEKTRLRLVYNICQRIGKAQYSQGIVITTPQDIGQLFVSELQFDAVEVVAIALLDARNQLIKLERISSGTVNSAVVYQQDVVRRAILHHACAVIIGHNHPSGVASPSPEDIELTNNLNKLLTDLNLRLMDHILVANNQFISFREVGII